MKFVYSCLILVNSFGQQATKRHLTQRIENLDGKLDDQKEISKSIKNEVQSLPPLLYYALMSLYNLKQQKGSFRICSS